MQVLTVHGARPVPPGRVDRLAQEAGTGAGADHVRHQAEVTQVDAGAGPRVQFEEPGWLAVLVQHVDFQRRVAPEAAPVRRPSYTLDYFKKSIPILQKILNDTVSANSCLISEQILVTYVKNAKQLDMAHKLLENGYKIPDIVPLIKWNSGKSMDENVVDFIGNFAEFMNRHGPPPPRPNGPPMGIPFPFPFSLFRPGGGGDGV